MSASPSSSARDQPRSECGPASTDIVVTYGFWLFLISDIVMFAAFFAAYAVLSDRTAGGPTGASLFDLRQVALETACLLTSTLACGMMTLATDRQHRPSLYAAAAATFMLGAAFIGLELSEFSRMVASGAGPDRSAFLSAFFALVGLHGLHVSVGLLWLLVMVAQVGTLGLSPRVVNRLRCFGLFWHTLDIVWIGVFTIVYLGAG
ncbi:MAG: cytochrome o ubiquinol oxidase subunit III [Rubrivivax sp.]